MRIIAISIITAIAISGCGGGSSTPIATDTPITPVAPITPIAPIECPIVPDPIVCEVCPPQTVCPIIEEPEPEIVTYYMISTATRDGDNIQDRVYNEQGYLLTDYNELSNTWYKYSYDENNNQTSYTIERDGVVISYTYATYDENSNQLTSTSDSGRAWVATYDVDNHRIRLEIDYNGDGVYNIEVYTYDGDNQIKIEKLTENRVENKRYDSNDNLIYSDIYIDEVLVQYETYTWQEFTEVL